jgi:hypothetical protein
MTPDFVAYVGDPDLHDGRVVTVRRNGSAVHVEVRGASRRRYDVSFSGTQTVTSHHPDGMLLYSVSEMRGTPPLRRFVFSELGRSRRCCA